ncbi:MAG: alginate lyase family protein, partial [Bdellovibrionales bacterium]|nr:alginate lyase family protein [Bdellovibrionales bacterium]
MARRLQLELARRLDVAVRKDRASPVSALPVAEALPQPLFRPRSGARRTDDNTWEFCFLNHTRNLGSPVDWLAGETSSGDQLWKMNLHYMEYLEAVTDEEFVSLVSGWIACNRPYQPGYWKDVYNSYTISIRSVVWMQQLAQRWLSLDEAFRRSMAASLTEQLRLLRRRLETDIRGNHLVKNGKTLLWASHFFGGKEADAWRSVAETILRSVIREQVLPDGVHFERSPSYHNQVFADLLECRDLVRDAALRSELEHTLKGMAQVSADLTHPDGTVALFNDAGCSMAYDTGEVLEVYRSLTGSSITPKAKVFLPAAGYFGVRSSKSFFIADCGPLGPDRLMAHAHGDILSFEWSVSGRRIIVDQGVYEYVSGSKRDQSRQAAAHNTVSVPCGDQGEFFGSFRCGARATGELTRFEGVGQEFVLGGTHSGFVGGCSEVRHQRTFTVTATAVEIHDQVLGAAP